MSYLMLTASDYWLVVDFTGIYLFLLPFFIGESAVSGVIRDSVSFEASWTVESAKVIYMTLSTIRMLCGKKNLFMSSPYYITLNLPLQLAKLEPYNLKVQCLIDPEAHTATLYMQT